MTLYRVSFAIGFLILIVGFILSILVNDPYLFRRFGALTTGYAACLVLLQIALENRFEAQKEENAPEPNDRVSPAKEKWIKKLTHRKLTNYAQKRMNIALIVATLALFGEIVHGFGDYFVGLFQ